MSWGRKWKKTFAHFWSNLFCFIEHGANIFCIYNYDTYWHVVLRELFYLSQNWKLHPRHGFPSRLPTATWEKCQAGGFCISCCCLSRQRWCEDWIPRGAGGNITCLHLYAKLLNPYIAYKQSWLLYLHGCVISSLLSLVHGLPQGYFSSTATCQFPGVSTWH